MINDRLIHTAVEEAVEEDNNNLILDLDANDIDSYDGDGDVWYDTHDFEFKPTTNVSEHFNTVIYDGTSSTNPISSVGFEPDLVWIKKRSGGTARDHMLYDSVRGAGYRLRTNRNYASSYASDELTSFDDDGFTLSTSDAVNGSSSSAKYVAWCFKAGGAAVTNTDGSITSQVSANNDLGFSIVSYTGNATAGATIGHGLDVKPELILIKSLDSIVSWIAYDTNINNVGYLDGNYSFLTSRLSWAFNSTVPTSALITLGSDQGVNNSGDMIAYCFASKRGVSKVGSYAGGAAGNKIYTGFEPAFVIVKRATGTGSWEMFDNARGITKKSWADLNSSEATNTSPSYIEFNRDGFEFPITSGGANSSGNTYIYYAVAKNTNETSLIPDTNLNTALDAGTYSGSGNWLDTSGNGNNGVITNATWEQELGNSFEFTGDDSINLGGSVRKALPMSVEMWINPSSTTRGVIYSNYDTSSIKGFFIRLESSLKFQLDSYNGSAGNRTLINQTGSALPLNSWTHCVFTFDTSQVKIYLNGELDTQVGTHASGIGFTSGFDSLLGRRAGGDLFYGLIGQTRVYDSTLSLTQIRQNFNFTKPSYPNGYNGDISGATWHPDGYFDFDGNGDSVQVDTLARITNYNFTMSIWLNTTDTLAYYVSFRDPIYITFGSVYTSSSVGMGIYDGSNQYLINNTAMQSIDDGNWHHVVLTHDGTNLKGYIDGDIIETVSTGTTTQYSGGTNHNRIGMRADGISSTYDFSGKVAQFRIYDKALTQAEISALYEEGE